MADGITTRIVTGPTLDALRRVETEIQRANVAAVRAAGQSLATAARRRAPVYAGPRPDVPKGRLRKGIKPGRVARQGTTAASVKVGPRGPVVHKYAGKIEQQEPYMDPAYKDTAATLGAVAAAAYAKAIGKAGR